MITWKIIETLQIKYKYRKNDAFIYFSIFNLSSLQSSQKIGKQSL